VISDAALKAEVAELVESAVRASGSARDWRNRRLAHRDFAVALATTDPLPGVSRDDVEAMLAAIRAVLDRLARHYWNFAPYEPDMVHGRETDALVYWLRRGLRAEEQRHQRFREGRALPEDIKPEEEI
jgi:hypothetical protein